MVTPVHNETVAVGIKLRGSWCLFWLWEAGCLTVQIGPVILEIMDN